MSGAVIAEGIAIVIDLSTAGVGAVDNLVQIINSSGPISAMSASASLIASVTAPIPGVGAATGTVALTMTLVNSAARGDEKGASLGEVVSAIGSVVSIVGSLLALGTPLGWTALGISAVGSLITAVGFGLNLQDMRNAISGEVNSSFRSAQGFRYSDPLVLDLDGDGLELRAADDRILFDHDANGTRTATGWVKSDDGILVRDVDGNGRIDSGRELFGDQTLKRDGTLAKNGFDALADLDSNGDGEFTSADEAWKEVKVWRDLNQDGISQENELFTLDQLGITRIGLNAKNSGAIANGNRLEQTATFTRNGKEQTIGAVDFQHNGFHREFDTPIELTDAAKNLPGMKGSGWVRDLPEAASLSSDLANKIVAFASAGTREAQMQQIDAVLIAWAQSSGQWTSLEKQLGASKVNIHMPANSMSSDAFRQMLALLEVFNGMRFYEATPTQQAALGFSQKPSGTGAIDFGPIYDITPPAQQLSLLQQGLDALRESVYGALVVQTRLKPYVVRPAEFVLPGRSGHESTLPHERSELDQSVVGSRWTVC